MGLDLRLPIGMMFSLIGAIMTIYGVATRGDAMYLNSLGLDVNLWWGLALLLFGIVMLVFARRGRQ